MIFYFDLLFPAFVTFLIVLVSTPFIISFAKQFGFIDDPRKHAHPAILHTQPVAKGGGVAIFLGILISCLLFFPFTNQMQAIIFGGLLIVIVGLLDDKYDLSPYPRLLSNFVVAMLPVLAGISIRFITNPVEGGTISFENLLVPLVFLGRDAVFILGDLLTIIWIAWTMNMLNWSSGVDGQMPGIAAISAIIIGILSLRFVPLDPTSLVAAKLSFITAGAALGFLFYNFHPARIFPGDSGLVIGFMLAIISIISGAKLATALLVMAVPTIDAVFTVARRISLGRSPFKSDRGHFHHLLLKQGFTVRQIAILYWVFSAILGSIALFLNSKQKFFAFLAIAVVVLGALVWLSFVARKEEK